MKKIIAVASAAILLLFLCTCGDDKNRPDDLEEDKVVQEDVRTSAEWPENEFTRQVSKPNGKIQQVYTSTDGDGAEHFTAVMDWKIDDTRVYIAEIKAAGFITEIDVDAETDYVYLGEKDGYTVMVQNYGVVISRLKH